MQPLESTAESEAAEPAPSASAPLEPTPSASAPLEPTPPPMQLDIACGRQNQLLIYGWILGLAEDIDTATVSVEEWSLDLTRLAIRVARPDVARHFSSEASAERDDHGFYLLADLPPAAADSSTLRVRATTHRGTSADYFFEIDRAADRAAIDHIAPYAETLAALLPALPPDEAARLATFVGAPVPADPPRLDPAPRFDPPRRLEPAQRNALDPPLRFVADFCAVLDERLLLVVGWLLDPFHELNTVTLELGSVSLDFQALTVAVARPDLAGIAAPFRQAGLTVDPGFFAAVMLPESFAAEHPTTAMFHFMHGGERIEITAPLKRGWTARRDFPTLLEGSDPDAVITMATHVAGLLPPPPADRGLAKLLGAQLTLAAARLPATLHHADPWYQLVIDQAVAVADQGMFLLGWFAASPDVESRMTLICRSGDASYDVAANWIRCARADVSSHLSQRGAGGGGPDHGFVCFIPQPAGSIGAHLAIEIGSAGPKRVRIATAPASEMAMPTVRIILNTFNSRHPQLRQLLDRHVGPAVDAAWSARYRAPVTPIVEHFGAPAGASAGAPAAAPAGAPAAAPEVSLIVPLFGRHDFVEYQLALFADDPDFRNAELIYVVDDPYIFEEFRGRCDGLYGMYRIPFTVVYPHSNLGFAGANNCGAKVARGKHLLLMNSDVMPKQNGWLGAMLASYRNTPGIGILGVKLLYENGSVQHAGMEFRRSTAWANMWINYHPFKGQSGLGLQGLHAIDAVTAACVLIEADLYRTLGGLSEEYIVGDFEDSDLCLRALEAGRRNYLALDIELYHLERQSQNRVGDGTLRTNLSIYNCWRHDRRWSGFIAGLKA